MPAGYSSRSLVEKLGIKPGFRVAVVGAPQGYLAMLDPLPTEVQVSSHLWSEQNLIHAFFRRRSDLERRFAELTRRLPSDGVLWISWPKKISGVATDLTEDVVREVALPTGYVDIKVIAIDGTWSGLKLVKRVALRG